MGKGINCSPQIHIYRKMATMPIRYSNLDTIRNSNLNSEYNRLDTVTGIVIWKQAFELPKSSAFQGRYTDWKSGKMKQCGNHLTLVVEKVLAGCPSLDLKSKGLLIAGCSGAHL